MDEAKVSNESMWLFFPLEIYDTFAFWKSDNNAPTIFEYLSIQGSLTSKLPSTWLTTKRESEKIFTTYASSSLTALSPTIRASYSASLLEAM